MFPRLAAVVVRFWPIPLIGWSIVIVISSAAAPPLNDVVTSGEFAFLPAESPSRVGERLFADSWDDSLASRVVIVVGCKKQNDKLTDDDKRFIEEVLRPGIERVAKELGGLAKEEEEEESVDGADPGPSGGGTGADAGAGTGAARRRSLIYQVRTYKDPRIGRLLESRDGRASLVIVELTSEFLSRENRETIRRIEELIAAETDRELGSIWDKDREWWKETGLNPRQVLQRLKLATSGEATVGRDMLLASDESAAATEKWTLILVVGLLVILYRAPLVALIPLVTVVVAVKISMSLLALGALHGVVDLFRGVEVYVTVISYGAGVDYCFFLIARYREELDGGLAPPGALERALGRVGAAVTASAGTVMCGIGMMVFARFGKFQQAGVAITFGLAVVLLAALTLTPALLRLAGTWAFWPRRYGQGPRGSAGWVAAVGPVGRWLRSNPMQTAWDRWADLLVRRPATIWLAGVLLLAPFAAWGVWNYTTLSYGLLSELPRDNPSVKGAAEVQAHFPAGTAGPVTLILRHESVDFGEYNGQGRVLVESLTNYLDEHRQQLKIADVRSLTHAYGLDEQEETGGGRATRSVRRRRIRKHYVSRKEDTVGSVTRLDVIFKEDPFSRDSIEQLATLTDAVADVLPRLGKEAEVPWPTGPLGKARSDTLFAIGPTASIRDLKQVTDEDQIRIDALVLLGVYAILLVLLRRPAISLYLIIGVFFSYLAALGVTFVVFEYVLARPGEFAGLDWKVPMFLFTILIAIGEDYNIFLMTRIEEEQAEHGLVGGVAEALKRTGSIIGGCGVIMAGTFSSLMFGSLVGMDQLGFALAFGVLLDTLVVMPILVPAWLILLYQGRFGRLGPLLGAPR